MSILSWGKCTIFVAPSSNGAPTQGEPWVELDTPKEDSTKLTPNAGNEVQATEEGGALVDFRRAKYTYDFETTLFVKKGVARPFSDNDGVVLGEFAIRVIPEDNTCEGIQIDRCMLSMEDNYTAADGKTIVIKAKILKPAFGNQVKPYTGEATLTLSCTASDGTVRIGTGTAGSTVSLTVAKGTEVTFSAIPAAGKDFTKWSDDDENATRSMVINTTTTLTATFSAE